MNRQLIDWAIGRVEKDYKDDVLLLLEHNTYTLEDDRQIRYVNSFITENDTPSGLARTFIVGGIGYDLQQCSWDTLEKKAALKDYYVTTLADATIQYAKSEEDGRRFKALQETLKRNLADKHYMRGRSLEWLDAAMEIYKSLVFETALSKVRKGAGFIADYLSVAVAYANETYYKRGVIEQVGELRKMERVPQDFITLYEQIITAEKPEELKQVCKAMIQNTRDFFTGSHEKQTRSSADFRGLAEWYQECSYYFRRIYHYCARNDGATAFMLSCGLQPDLEELSAEYGLPALDLLQGFHARELDRYAVTVRGTEQTIVNAIEEHGAVLDSYATVEDFVKLNT